MSDPVQLDDLVPSHALEEADVLTNSRPGSTVTLLLPRLTIFAIDPVRNATMSRTKFSSKDQIVIPKDVRERAKIRVG